MKHALLLCLSLLAPAVPACAQTVIDGSDKAASPFVKNTLKSVATQFPDAHPHFRNLATHKTGEKQIVCGEVSLQDTKTPAAESFMPFGATEEKTALLFLNPTPFPPRWISERSIAGSTMGRIWRIWKKWGACPKAVTANTAIA